MARHLPSTALLNLGDVELEEVVQPLNEFLSVRKKRKSLASNPKKLPAGSQTML